MRRLFVLGVALVGVVAGGVGPVVASAATPVVKVSPRTGHPSAVIRVTGSGFGASEAVDVYFDTTDVVLAVTSPTGGFTVPVTVPASAQPGGHWVSAVGRADGLAAQAKFTVRTDWPQFGFDARDQRVNPYENTLTPSTASGLDEAWQFKATYSIYSSPAVVGGVAYFGDANFGPDDGNVYAVNAATGVLKWKFAAGSQVISSPAVSGGTVYVGASNGHVYALKAATGAVKWDDDLSGLESSGFYGSPTVAGGTVYIGGTSGNVYALDAAIGFSKWVGLTGGPIRSAPAVAGGDVFVESEDQNLYAFNASTGASVWSLLLDGSSSSGGSVIAGPAVANGRVFVGTVVSNVQGIRVSDGSRLWTTPLSSFGVDTSPAVNAGVVYVNDGAGPLVALNTATGTTLWTAGGTANVFDGSPAYADGVVYTHGFDAVEAYRASDGTLLWSADDGSQSRSSPTVTNGTVYMATLDGVLRAYTLGTTTAASRPAPATLRPSQTLRPTRTS